MVVPTRLPLVADGEHKRQERFGTLWPILTSVEIIASNTQYAIASIQEGTMITLHMYSMISMLTHVLHHTTSSEGPLGTSAKHHCESDDMEQEGADAYV